ncbi:MAG: hypothetical protein ACKOXB_13215 [Flavobacteriales bacterium]
MIILFWLISFCIGNFFLSRKNFLQEKPFQRFFLSSLLGQILLATLTALFFTKGNSIFILMPLLAFAYYFLFRDKENQPLSPTPSFFSGFSTKNILLLLLVLMFVFSWIFYASTDPKGSYLVHIPNIFDPNKDFYFYSTIGHFMMVTGVENEVHAHTLTHDSYHVATAYHYYELWLNNLISLLTNGISVKRLYLVTYPLITFTSAIGIISVAEFFGKIKFRNVLIGLCFLFMGGVFFQVLADKYAFFANLSFYDDFLCNMTPNKVGHWYSFIIAALILMCNKKWGTAMLFMLALAVAYYTAFVTMFFAAFTGIWVLRFTKQIDRKLFFQLLLTLLCFVVLFFSFYEFVNKAIIHRGGTDIKSALEPLLHTNDLMAFVKSKISFIGVTVIYYSLLYFLPVVLLLLFRKHLQIKNEKFIFPVFILTILIVTGGLMGWVILSDLANSEQIFIHSASITLNMSLIFLFFILIRNTNHLKSRYILYSGIFIIAFLNSGNALRRINDSRNCYHGYSEEYLGKTGAIMQSNDDLKMVAIVRAPHIFNSLLNKHTTTTLNGCYLQFFSNDVGILPIDDLDIPLTTNDPKMLLLEKNAIAMGGFFQYVRREKEKGVFVSKEQSQLTFIKENNIRYLIMEKNTVLPSSLLAIIGDRIADPKSKEVFYTLKY